MKKKLFLSVIILSLIIYTGVVFAQTELDERAPGEQTTSMVATRGEPLVKPGIMKTFLENAKGTFFKMRLAQLVSRDQAIIADIAKKIANTPGEEFTPLHIRVLIDYLSSIGLLTGEEINNYINTELPKIVQGVFTRIALNLKAKMESDGELFTTLFVASLGENNQAAINEALNYIASQKGVAKAAFVDYLSILETRLKFDINNNCPPEKLEEYKTLLQKVTSILKSAKAENLASYDENLKASILKMDYRRIWRFLGRAILVEIQDIPSEIERSFKIDLNRAGVADLKKVPGVTDEIANAIVGYRTQNGAIMSVAELNRIKGIGDKTLRKLKTCCYVNEFRLPEKEWTIMCFINGDNDLERASVLGVNSMEKIGSTNNMNVVVQLDRIGVENLSNNPNQDSWIDGNWNTTRRYYIKKDTNPFVITSVLMDKLGEKDMGDARTLFEFVIWAIKRFPARRYALLISNHGSEIGTGGVSFDNTSRGNFMSTSDLAQVFDAINKAIQKIEGSNKKLDVIIFDCCLLAKLETIIEIAPFAKAAFGCENVQINWYGYHNWLSCIDKNPQASAQSIAVSFLKAYADYMRWWTKKHGVSTELTGTAFNLEAADKFLSSFNAFVKAGRASLSTDASNIKKAIESQVPVVGVSVFDLYRFVQSVRDLASSAELKAAADSFLKAFREPARRNTSFIPNIYPADSFILAEAHNEREKDAHGISILLPIKEGWKAYAASNPKSGLNDELIDKLVSIYLAPDSGYRMLRLNRLTEWDELLVELAK